MNKTHNKSAINTNDKNTINNNANINEDTLKTNINEDYTDLITDLEQYDKNVLEQVSKAGVDWFANELIRKNMSVAWLISKAKELPYCRKNILITKILCWDKHITLLAYDIISGRDLTVFDTNFRCKEFITINKLANTNLIEFFFDFHESIANFYTHQIQNILQTDATIQSKIIGIFQLYIELMNISRIELEGFDISCEIIGNNHMCKENICKNQPNIITVFPTPESIEDQSVLRGYVNSFKRILPQHKHKVNIVVDYRNVCKYVKCYDWEKANAWERYQNALKYVNNVYFYNYPCVSFGKYYKYLNDNCFLFKSEKQYKNLYKTAGKTVCDRCENCE